MTPAHIFKTARRQIRKIRHRGAQTETERRLLASANQQRDEGLGWRFDGFGALSTEDIFAALARLGVASDADSFRVAALDAGSPTALGERWDAKASGEGKWRDLIVLAPRELWRRLLPDRLTGEVVADEVDELLELAEVSDERTALWLRAARRIVDTCLRGGTADKTLFEHVVPESGNDLVGWMIEMPSALVGTDLQDQAPGLCECFAQLVDTPAMLAERAEILARIGRREEAIAQIETLLADHSDQPVVLLKAGGTYEKLGDFEKSQLYLRLYTTMMQAPGSSAAIAAASKAKIALQPVKRVEPNDRCPCGSGRKYKRCHGLPS